METKHAYLIIAHNEFKILKILLSMLDDERNDIYLHIDKKVRNLDLTGFQTKKSKLIILDKRVDVRWGDFSQIKLELLLFETAYNNGQYMYFHLLSGVDLPIQTQDYIHRFFEVNKGYEFVGYGFSLKERMLKYYILTRYYRCNNKMLNIIMRIIRRICSISQDLLHYRRNENMVYCKGANWVSITSDLVSVLLQNKDFILKRFKYTYCGDEFLVQSILWNSALKDNIYNLDDEFLGCMRFIDWERGEPYVWKNEDFEELKSSEKLFARKFSSGNMEIVRKIQKEYSNVE
ncbi:beta-1,6-N-acetylglucosaminyltransferase [Parabacteroides sp.]